MKKTGRVFNSAELAREYGFVDVDGRSPKIWEWISDSKFRYKKIDDGFYAYFNMDYDHLEKEVKKLQREIKAADRKKSSPSSSTARL
jgi:hypothetical protein